MSRLFLKTIQLQRPGRYIRLMTGLCSIFIFVMTVVFPLFAPTGHMDIGKQKWNFYSVCAIVFILFMVIIGAGNRLYLLILDKKRKKAGSESGGAVSVAAASKSVVIERDHASIFAVGYMAVCLISTVMSYDRATAVFGFREWYMGLIAQLSFCLIYLFVSGNWRFKKPLFMWAIAGSLVVFCLGVANRFGSDPLSFYTNRTEKQIFDYLSTVGQTTHYSSYLCLLLPLAIVGYCFGKRAKARVLCGLVMAVGFMSTVTQNSDSAYIALAAYMAVLCFVAFSEYWIFLRFMDVVIICLASFKVMGIALSMNPEIAQKLDRISVFLSQSLAATCVLAILLIIRLVIQSTERGTGTAFLPGYARWIVQALLVAGIAGGTIYIYMNTRGMLPAEYSSANNYLLFNDGWGNHRGVEWRAAVGGFIKEPSFRKIIGAGPDCFAHMAYKYYSSDLNRELDGLTLQNCHNEWLNCLVNTGILGLITYLGIFISVFVACMKRGKQVYWLYGVAMAIAAYMAHNFFCYQSVTCTPIVFLLMGMAGAVIRQMETGKSIWKNSENVSS